MVAVGNFKDWGYCYTVITNKSSSESIMLCWTEHKLVRELSAITAGFARKAIMVPREHMFKSAKKSIIYILSQYCVGTFDKFSFCSDFIVWLFRQGCCYGILHDIDPNLVHEVVTINIKSAWDLTSSESDVQDAICIGLNSRPAGVLESNVDHLIKIIKVAIVLRTGVIWKSGVLGQ